MHWSTAQHERRLELLSHASLAFTEVGLHYPAVLDRVASELARALDCRIQISLFDGDEELESVALANPGVRSLLRAFGDELPTPDAFHSEACIDLPLRTHSRLIGMVSIGRAHPDDMPLLEDLALRAACAIDNARMYQDKDRAATLAEQQHRFACALVTCDCVEQAFDALFDVLEATLGIKHVTLVLHDEHGKPRVAASRGLSLDLPRILRQPTLVIKASDLRGPVRAPIVREERTLGELVLHDERGYRAREIAMLLSYASHTGSAIRRFALIDELRERVEREQMLAGILAHDLRAPLAAILTTAGTPVSSDVAKQAMRLRRISSSARRMKIMIDQLLDFTRIRMGGEIDINPRETSLFDLCATVVSELEHTKIHCTIDQTTRGDPRGIWDPDRMLQVLSNVIGNACAHGCGTVVNVTIDGMDPDIVVFEVENEGAIPPDVMHQLFVPFRRSKRSAGSSGLGLGFYISKQIIEAHGGQFTVTSRESTGTTCRATLPRVCPMHAQ